MSLANTRANIKQRYTTFLHNFSRNLRKPEMHFFAKYQTANIKVT